MRTLHLAPAELEIGPTEGFSPEKDIFGRRDFGERLCRIVRAIEGPAVLLLDGEWGTGKTTFVKMWLGDLSKAHISSIYFDAFANDYHDDAFIALAGEIIAQVEDNKPSPRRALEVFRGQALQTAKALARAGVKVGIRVASAGLLTGEEVAGITITGDETKALGEEGAKAIDELLKERLDSHKSDKKIFSDFQKALETLAETLSISDSSENTAEHAETHPPLIFVIDELDRCRPVFALQLIEKIKHFFSVPNIVFMLVTNLRQLENSVRYAYGDINARTYLEKFYHFRLLFPVGRNDRPDAGALRYLSHLLQQLPPASNNYNVIIDRYHRVNYLSFRTLERIYAYLHLTTMSMRPNSVFVPEIIAVLSILKVVHPEVYDIARAGQLSFAELNKAMRFSEWRELHDPVNEDRISQYAENVWRYALGETLSESTKAQFASSDTFFSFRHPSEIVSYYCEHIDGFAFPGA